MRGPGSAVGAPMNSNQVSFNQHQQQQQQSSANSYVSTQPVQPRPNYYQSPGASSGYAASGVGSYIQTQEFSRGPPPARQFAASPPGQMFDDGGSMIGPSASQIGQTNILASKGINMQFGGQNNNNFQTQKFQTPMSMNNPVMANFQTKMVGGSTLSVPPMAPIEEVRITRKTHTHTKTRIIRVRGISGFENHQICPVSANFNFFQPFLRTFRHQTWRN